MSEENKSENPNCKVSPKNKNRYQKREKQKKAKRKKLEKDLFKEKEYEKFLETYLIPSGFSSSSSPHLIIRRQFNKIEENSIILKNPRIVSENKKRNISYEIDKIGSKIATYGKSKYMNLDLSSTDGCKVMLLIHLKDTINIPHLCYFTENGRSLTAKELNHDVHGYVLLATIKLTQNWVKKSIMLNDNDYETVKKHRNNQVKKKSKGYHFDTTGEIYSFGYTPTYSKDPITGHSIARYAESKYVLNFVQHETLHVIC